MNYQIWLEITQSLSNRLKFSTSPSSESPCHGVRIPPPLGFFLFLKKLSSQKALAGQYRVGREGWKEKGGKSTGDGGNGGKCTGDVGWNTGALVLAH